MKYTTKLKLSHAVEAIRGVTILVRLCMTFWFTGLGFLELLSGELKNGLALMILAVCVCPVWDKE